MTAESQKKIGLLKPKAQISRFRAAIAWMIETHKEFRIRQRMLNDFYKKF